MGIGITEVQLLLELHNQGKFNSFKNILDIGSHDLHVKKEDLRELVLQAGIDDTFVDQIENIDNWPSQPRASAKALYSSLGITEYSSFDINGEIGAIPIDLNLELKDNSLFNKFDIVTDFGTCEHIFNVSECYKTIHKITKVNGLIIINQSVFKGNGYFQFDRSFMEGIAAANNYKIIYACYVVGTSSKTSNGTAKKFQIPLSEDLIKSFKDISSLTISMVLQKTSNDNFKIPYQGILFNQKYNMFGFNKIYSKDDLSLSYIPVYNIEGISFTKLLKVLLNKLRKRFKF